MSVLDNVEPEWAGLAVHEIGHAVAFKAAKVPVHKIKLNRGFFNGVSGVTWINDAIPKNGPLGLLVGIMAGGEAEALYLKRYHGLSLGAARRAARHGGHDDQRDFAEFAHGTGISQGKARNHAESLVRSEWRRIEKLAAKLARNGSMSGWGV